MMWTILVWLCQIFFTMGNALGGWSMPPAWLETITTIIDYIRPFEGLIPVNAMFQVISSILFFEIAMLFLRIIFMIINFGRGTGRITLE